MVTFLLETNAEVATDDQWHYKVESLRCREEIMHVAQVGMIALEENLKLRVYRIDRRSIRGKLVLADVLDSILFGRVTLEM